MGRCLYGILLLVLAPAVLAAQAIPLEESSPRRGEVHFVPAEDEAALPARFQLSEHRFSFEQVELETVATRIRISEVRFPSPVATPHPNNNTVHCEYFRPAAEGKFPGVVVLHILGGDFPLSRLFCRTMAHHGIAALFLKLPYYGPRRQPGSPARMVSLDPEQTVQGMTQGVLDIRRARAWLASQDEIDRDQLGVFGISLGGITSALAATAEPRFGKVCMVMAGGDMGAVGWSSPQFKDVRGRWLASGRTKEEFFDILKQVDPVSYAENARGRTMLMLNVRYDEIIPRPCTDALWNAFGQPEIHWWDSGHKSAARFMFDGLARVTRFFQADSAECGTAPQTNTYREEESP